MQAGTCHFLVQSNSWFLLSSAFHSTAKTRWTGGFQVILLKALNISLAGYWIIVFQNLGNKRLDSKKKLLFCSSHQRVQKPLRFRWERACCNRAEPWTSHCLEPGRCSVENRAADRPETPQSFILRRQCSGSGSYRAWFWDFTDSSIQAV